MLPLCSACCFLSEVQLAREQGVALSFKDGPGGVVGPLQCPRKWEQVAARRSKSPMSLHM